MGAWEEIGLEKLRIGLIILDCEQDLESYRWEGLGRGIQARRRVVIVC